MRFDQKLMAYCFDKNISSRKMKNCYKLICKVQEDYGGFTLLQILTIKTMLKSMYRNVQNDSEKLNTFIFLFDEIMNFDGLKK